MKPAPFRYHAPKTIDEAVETLAEVAPDDGRVLAGGQSLVPIMAFRLARPSHLVDINGVEALKRLAVDGDKLSIGACVRHAAFHRPVADGPLGLLLAKVVRHIAHHPIRTRGTFCGSVAHADPASEWCLVAVTLDAEMVAKSVRGERMIPARDYFEGIMTTALAEDELLTEVRLPILPADTRFGFYEFNRRAGDYAIAMALVTYRVVNGVMADPACRRRRRRAAAAPHRPRPRSCWPARRPAARRSRPRLLRLPLPSIRWKMPPPAPNIAATSSAPSRGARWSRPPHERQARGLPDECPPMTGGDKWIGQSVERLEDPPLVTGRGRFAGDIKFPHQLHMRLVALEPRPRPDIVAIDTAEAARRCPAWSRCGPRPTSPTCRRSISARAASRSSSPIASRCWRPAACAIVGEPVAAVFAVDPYVAEDAADLVTMEIEELPALLDAVADRRASSRPAATPRPTIIRQGYGDVDAALRAAPRHRRTRARHRPPLRRAAGDARRNRPLRRLARYAGAARRRQGAAPQPRTARADAQAPAVVDPCARGACRRRLRHPRRALSRGRAGLRRRDAARAPGEMDRGPPRASDRRQPFAPAAPPHPRRSRCTTAASSPSTTSSCTTRAPMCAPTRPASP